MTSIVSAPFLKWPTTRKLMALLGQANIDARFVGGCVRDAILGRDVKDIDLASSTEPEEALHALTELGAKAIPTGIEHGTITIVIDETPFELTTLRRDVDCDGRHAIVAYTTDWEQDAKRRDFTINALYADMDGKLFDYNNGLKDLRARQLRFIGEPKDRIKEDALRILRLFRFQAQLDFEVDKLLYVECKKSARLLTKISAERIAQETMKLLDAKSPTPAWHALFEYGIADKLYDGLLVKNIEFVASAEQQLMNMPLEANQRLILLALLADEYDVDELKNRLKLSNALSKNMSLVLEYTEQIKPDSSLKEQRKWHYMLGTGIYSLCIIGAATKELRSHIDRSLDAYKNMLSDAAKWQPPSFELSGQDLMALGYSEGEELGKTLKLLEARWVESGFEMDKDQLLATIQSKAS